MISWEIPLISWSELALSDALDVQIQTVCAGSPEPQPETHVHGTYDRRLHLRHEP